MTAVAPGIVYTEKGHWGKIIKKNPKHKKYLNERAPLEDLGL